LNKTNIYNTVDVLPGAIISYLQKGLLYKEMETHLNEDGQEVNCESPFSLIYPHECRINEKKEKDRMEDIENSERESQDEDLDMKKSNSNMTNNITYFNDEQVTILEGHNSEVFICAWNPVNSLLASGSGDSTARIWSVPPGPSGTEAAQIACQNPLILKHTNNNQESKDVTTLDWNGTGNLLATGSYDGLARIWNDKGELRNVLFRHRGPIFSLKWNKKGDCLLSGSVDKTAIVWDAATGEVKQQFEFHKAPTLDVDWRNNTTFATCSTDCMIYVCELGRTKPIKCFQGHTDEVNAIKWDPSGSLLASCSDDTTAKIWSLNSGRDTFIHDFREHSKEIYTIKWSPTGPGSANPNQKLVLASASFDSTIKIWDVEVGTRLYTLTKHTDPVYSVSFSPSGEFLASGSFDRCLHIWSLKDGSLIRTYKGTGGIFEVCWNNTGDKVAACFSNNTVCVVDARR